VSRIGKKPVTIVKGVTVTKENNLVRVKGPKGELTTVVHPRMTVEIKGTEVLVARSSDSKEDRAIHGTTRAIIQTLVDGVVKGFSKKLEIVGVGYRAELKGKNLQLALGYSHPIIFSPPSDVHVEVPTQTSILISGIDKQLVGMVASKIRSFRPPEPYKGKGVKYEGEYIRRKAGKAAAGAK